MAYLGWLGCNLIWTGIQKLRSNQTVVTDTATGTENLQNPFKRALFISLLNPKAILFLLSFFVQFIDTLYPTPAVPFLILSAVGGLLCLVRRKTRGRQFVENLSQVPPYAR